MKALLLSLTFAALACAQPALAPPQIGFMLDSGNSIRAVSGIAGNFLLGNTAASNVLESAFSGSFGIVISDSFLTVTDRQGEHITSQDAPAGRAFFAFSRDGSPALAFFPESNVLLAWTGGSFQPTYLDWSAFPAACVRALASPDPTHASFLVQRDDGLWDVRILLSSGAMDSQAALPAVTGPAFALPTGDLIFSDTQGVVIRRTDTSEIHVQAQLPAHFSLHQMGDNWIEVRDLDSCARFAIRVTPGQEAFYVLPEVES